MRKLLKYLLSFLLIPTALAAPSEAIEGISDAVFLPLFENVRPLFVKLNVVIGGIFGATLVLIIVRIYYEHRTIKILKAIRFDLDQSNKHLGLQYSSQKKGLIYSLVDYWKAYSHERALKKIDKIKKVKKKK